MVLNYTGFSGSLPHSIGNLKMLSTIDLSNCNFRGSIPDLMASLTQLVYLDMSLNMFCGSIPVFSMAKNLTNVDLSSNNLTGQITSTQWEELLHLDILDLSYNSLNGNIPVLCFPSHHCRHYDFPITNFLGNSRNFPPFLLTN
jgi:Leucine-rich repeat (LRR) protein